MIDRSEQWWMKMARLEGDQPIDVGAVLLQVAVERANFARRLAKSLMMFPLNPERGDPNPDQFYECLETSFTAEITRMLNDEMKA